MPDPQLMRVACDGPAGPHRMAYWQWGTPEAAHVIVCVHGLSRQGRDFDVLARALVAAAGAAGVRVVCPDVAGRGHSDRLADPAGYAIPTYAADMLALLAQLHAQAPIARLDWVGTSMGGLIGLALCGTPDLPLPVPVERLVLNDVGPAIEWAAIERIGMYLGRASRFESVQAAADAMALISTGFGPHTPQEWLALSEPMVRAAPEGGYVLHYDPAIAAPFRALKEEDALKGTQSLWALYDQVKARTLLLRGAQSDLLTRETALAMTQRGPRATLVEFEGVGHAPTLVARNQVEQVVAFLFEGAPIA